MLSDPWNAHDSTVSLQSFPSRFLYNHYLASKLKLGARLHCNLL